MATRDIPLGDLICVERPLNRGPKPSTRPVCLGCYLPLLSASALCPDGCGWPVCSEDCPLLQREHKSECEHFRRCNFRVEVSNSNRREKYPKGPSVNEVRIRGRGARKDTSDDSQLECVSGKVIKRAAKAEERGGGRGG